MGSHTRSSTTQNKRERGREGAEDREKEMGREV